MQFSQVNKANVSDMTAGSQFHTCTDAMKALPRVKARAAARGITAQSSPIFGSYTVSAVPMMNVPPTQVAARHDRGRRVVRLNPGCVRLAFDETKNF